MRVISDFQLLEEIYSFGTTRVFRAIRIEDSQQVILKILSGEFLQSDAFVQYQREYQIIDSLKDIEGVITVYDLANIQNSLMIVEEDIGAKSLDMILAEETINLKEALQLAIRLAGILDQIHQHHVIHKDLNPSNIVWNRLNDELRVIDFGIASQLSQERQEFQSVNQLEGNLAYISPEQTGRINRKLDYRSDLYSFGISLYQLFTGTRPFVSQDGIELVHAHIAVTPVFPSELNPQIPLVLSQIVMRLIEKMADDRYQSAQGVQHDLERCLEQLQESGEVAAFTLAERDVSIKFQIPQKLYGREQEIFSIIKAFDRIAQGSTELLLVTGLSGTGKSALVYEVHKPLTEKRGNFVGGKFDQYQRDVPFYAWTQALEAFCKLLLKEDDASIERWRERILMALGNIGKVITDVIPSIELIIGKQPEVPPLSGEQALNRLNYAFENFLEAVCREEHPLAIFIDDWQWADTGSLSLLKSVTGSKAIKYLLLIGAYRDNETHDTHPFSLALEGIKKTEAEVSTINLQDLQQHDVRSLIKDLLNDAPGLDEITRLVYEKTQGNAFFLIQLLNDLYEKSVIRFCSSRQHWVWQPREIESRTVADNVIELMAEKIRKLPESTQCSITYGACIGDRFDLATLAAIQQKPAHEIASNLELALIEGILVPIDLNYRVAKQENNTSNVYYQFIHDRVRQAAYGMLEQPIIEETHYAIAKIWLEETSAEQQNRPIFDIANQYNAGRRLIIQARQQLQLIDINLEAGKRAKNATDYASALHYFQIALELGGPDCWQTMSEQQSAELHLLAAEMAFLSKDYASMELWLDDYLDHVSAPLAQVKAFKVRLQAYVAQNRLSEALDSALHGLRLLEIKLPKAPNLLQVINKLLHTKALLKKKNLADLHALPEMTDPAKLEAMELLGLALPPAYWTSQELVSLIVFQMVHESVIHGYSPNAGYGYSWWGITECAMLGNIDAGYEFGEFAIELAKKHQLNLQQPLFFAAWIIRKFKQPLRETITVFEQTYALSLEKGDFEYASYARNNTIQTLFHTGHSLDALLSEMELAHRDLLRFQLGSSLYWHDIWWQTALNFVQESAQPHLLGGPAYDEAVSLPQHLKVNDASTLFLLYCAKLMLSCFFNEKDHALNYAKQARFYSKGGIGMHAFVLFHFYESLALIANRESAGLIGKLLILYKVRVNQRKLKKWAAYAPDNYRHHWLLVEAEYLRISGQSDKATRYYDLAIDQAQRNGFIHEEALGNELAARCYIRREQNQLAVYYLKQALHLYERWGSRAKVAQLKAEFAHLLLTVAQSADHHHALRSRSIPHSSGNIQQDGAFDVSAITQASQAISGEIRLDKLITTLLKISIKHSGAQKALLILNNGKKLSIQAQGWVKQGAIDVQVDDIEINDRGDLPLPRSMIQYVSRTLTAQVIHDTREFSRFFQDPYMLREKPLSVLCMPIVQQGKLMGMLYLENNLTVGAFTEQRFELLRLLSSQAAISIENATLYGFLEQKVEERTQKLQASLEAQEHLNSELQISSQQLKNAHAELSEANRQLQQQANTDGLTGLANRRYFIGRLQYELDLCAREQQPIALIICDLDNFKRYNDTYGHVEGDACLRKTAKAFSSVFNRATDLVARYGGEEFVILLPRTTSDQAEYLGASLCKAVEALNIPHIGNAQYGVATLSAGCYLFIPDGNTVLEAMIAQADKALYQAKNQGRNCFVQIREGQEALSC
ncbi:MAG: diguanylate cyclase domain-containing protein [Methylobacter sp.]